MAKLTETLGTVNSGKPIINPGPADPSFLGVMADAASAAIPGIVGIGRERDRRSAQAKEDDNAAALDSLAGGVFDARRESASEALRADAPMPQWMGAVDSNTMVPYGVMGQANEILRVQRAVTQGRVSQGSLDMRIENLVSTLFQQHPDSRYEISVAMKGLGIDHYMFRDEQSRRAMEDAGEEAQIATQRTQIDYAASRGLVTSETRPVEAARIGRMAMAEAARAEAAKAEADRVRADRTLSAQESEAALKAAGAEVQTALIAQAVIATTPLMDATMIAVSAAGTDAERQTVIGEYRVQTRAALLAYRTRGIGEIAAAGGDAAPRKEFTDLIDSQIEAVDGLYNTSFEQNVSSSQNLAAALNIDMARALPMYNRIQAAIGPAAASAIINVLDGVPGLDPRMIELAKQEITNFDPTSARGTMSLARAIGYLRGEVGLKDLTAEEATAYIRTNSVALAANQTAVLSGDTSALAPWTSTYANTAEAVAELGVTTTTVSSLSRASLQLATPGARQALDVARRDAPEYGQALTQASRAGAAHALNVVNRTPSANDNPFTTVYDHSLGRFKAVLTPQAYDGYVASVGAADIGRPSNMGFQARRRDVPTYEEMRRQIPQETNQRLTAQNNFLTHLTETDKYDEAIPSSLSTLERRRMYATGATPESMRARGGDNPTQAGEWERIRGNLSTQIQSLLTETVSAPIATMPARERVMNYEARDVGIDVVPETVRTLGDASTFARQVNRAGANSSAMGTYQITGDTLRDFAPRVFGENWENVTFDGTAQDRIAEAIFNSAKHSAAALSGRWVSLSRAEAERVRQMPWEQARVIIAQGESG